MQLVGLTYTNTPKRTANEAPQMKKSSGNKNGFFVTVFNNRPHHLKWTISWRILFDLPPSYDIFFSENYGNDFMLNQQWQNYIRKMKLELPPFTEVMAFLRPHLRPYWERLNPSQGDNIN